MIILWALHAQANYAMQEIYSQTFEQFLQGQPSFEARQKSPKKEVIYIAFNTCISSRTSDSCNFGQAENRLKDNYDYSYALSWPDFMNDLAQRDDITCKVLLFDKGWGYRSWNESTFADYMRKSKNPNLEKTLYFITTSIHEKDEAGYKKFNTYMSETIRSGGVVILGCYNRRLQSSGAAYQVYHEPHYQSDLDFVIRMYNHIQKTLTDQKSTQKITLLSSNTSFLVNTECVSDFAVLWWIGNQFHPKYNFILTEWLRNLRTTTQKFIYWQEPIMERNLVYKTGKINTLEKSKLNYNRILYDQEAYREYYKELYFYPELYAKRKMSDVADSSYRSSQTTFQELLYAVPEKFPCKVVALTSAPGSKLPVLKLGVTVEKDTVGLEFPDVPYFDYLNLKQYYLDIFKTWNLPEDLLNPFLPLQILNSDLQALSMLPL